MSVRFHINCAALAQKVERFHGKEEVPGSNPGDGLTVIIKIPKGSTSIKLIRIKPPLQAVFYFSIFGLKWTRSEAFGTGVSTEFSKLRTNH